MHITCAARSCKLWVKVKPQRQTGRTLLARAAGWAPGQDHNDNHGESNNLPGSHWEPSKPQSHTTPQGVLASVGCCLIRKLGSRNSAVGMFMVRIGLVSRGVWTLQTSISNVRIPHSSPLIFEELQRKTTITLGGGVHR